MKNCIRYLTYEEKKHIEKVAEEHDMKGHSTSIYVVYCEETPITKKKKLKKNK